MSLLLIGTPIGAQDDEIGVYVTTQDFSSLRTGPNTRFDRIDVVPPDVTLMAIGRSADMRWVQVDYDGQPGWIASWLLVWSGDIVTLPVDGAFVQEPFIRRMVVAGITTRDAPLYRRYIDANDQVGVIPADTEVEITGRLGERGFYWLQIRWEGQQYWVGSWDVDITNGRIDNVLDTAYLFPYGRLNNRLDVDAGRSLSSLLQIENIWVNLAEADSVSCEDMPNFTSRTAVDNDIAREPVFEPVVTALDTAVIEINTAISTFEDACARLGDPDAQLTQRDVRSALTGLEIARRNLTLARAVLNSLSANSPYLIVIEDE